jgi:hypothetical protein
MIPAPLRTAALVLLACAAGAARADVLISHNDLYVKECGACHTPFSPQLLPAASWRKLMSHLDDHFGDSAKLDAPTQQALTRYLESNAADNAQNSASRSIMQSIHPGQVPERITQVPYIADLHKAVLDPLWNGKPRPKTLTECSVCHTRANAGNFTSKSFTVNDEAFRGAPSSGIAR